MLPAIDLHVEHPNEQLAMPSHLTRRLSALFNIGFTVEPMGAGEFHARLQPVSIGKLRLAQVDFSPHKTRPSLRPKGDTNEWFLLNQVVSGRLFISQDGRECEVGPGELHLVNTAREFTLESEAMRANSVYLNASLFRSVFPEVDYCAAVKLSTESGPGKIVGDLLTSLFEMAPRLEPETADRFADAMPHLLAIALADQARGGAVCPSKINLFHKERVKTYIRENLANPDLSCAMVSHDLRLSQRYIYDIFANEPLTLMRWVRSERLNRCHRELATPALCNRSISEIAFAWGFVDLAHFSRTFSGAYGVSPRAFRRLSCPETSH